MNLELISPTPLNQWNDYKMITIILPSYYNHLLSGNHRIASEMKIRPTTPASKNADTRWSCLLSSLSWDHPLADNPWTPLSPRGRGTSLSLDQKFPISCRSKRPKRESLEAACFHWKHRHPWDTRWRGGAGLRGYDQGFQGQGQGQGRRRRRRRRAAGGGLSGSIPIFQIKKDDCNHDCNQ